MNRSVYVKCLVGSFVLSFALLALMSCNKSGNQKLKPFERIVLFQQDTFLLKGFVDKNNQVQGMANLYNSKRGMKIDVAFRNDTPNGIAMVYVNDTLVSKASYKNGLKDGYELLYAPIGKLLKISYYEENKLKFYRLYGNDRHNTKEFRHFQVLYRGVHLDNRTSIKFSFFDPFFTCGAVQLHFTEKHSGTVFTESILISKTDTTVYSNPINAGEYLMNFKVMDFLDSTIIFQEDSIKIYVSHRQTTGSPKGELRDKVVAR